MKRPDRFSDSEIINQVTLPKEVLTHQLSIISTNQKQDEFETLCRRLAEKFIAPNLIPQVGPTGGGDGKTDSETYPVSASISDRWFVPENGWEKDEKWAFAISAKKSWKDKAGGDIKKIIGTKRDYTRIYFMTNQLVSSKKKKDAQDEFKNEFNIEVIILDGEWILEKIYNNNLMDLAIDCLNLSNIYGEKKIRLGANDANRLKELEEIENNIANPNRYSEYDFQLVEDALKSAILSRMLERPRDEVEGKFDRAIRFCKRVNNPKQWLRIYYQRAWTYCNWYDDYPLFIEDYRKLKTYISKASNISSIELYFNLFNLLNAISFDRTFSLSDYKIEIEEERREIADILTEIENDKERPNSALTAETYKVLIELTPYIKHKKNPDSLFKELSSITLKSSQFLDFPFETFKQTIEELGTIFPNHREYDNLIDNMASVSEKRDSELASGEIFMRRAIQKLEAEYYKESIIYFGKAVMKFAKEETRDSMYLVLLGLGMAYRELGLIWASNNCAVSALSLSFRSISESGILSKRTYQSIQEIVKNELFIGRIPSFFAWYEMYSVLPRAPTINESGKGDILPFVPLTDGCLSTRIMHVDNTHKEPLQLLPDLLEKLELYMSQSVALYKLGYIDEIISYHQDIKDEQGLDEFYGMVANQPFVKQMLYKTNFMAESNLCLYSNILGCKFLINFARDIELLLVAETLLAFFEGFFATSMIELIAHAENITINLGRNKEDGYLAFTYNEISFEYELAINNFNVTAENINLIRQSILEFITDILIRHFVAKDIKQYVENLFKNEEIQQRLFLVVEHRNFTFNLLGNTPKLFFDDWLKYRNPNKYVSKREKLVSYIMDIKKVDKQYRKENMDKIRHDEIETHSIIDIPLWDAAKWKGFGFLIHPQEGLGIILAYQNSDAAKKIFDKWINKFGNEDKEELIRITIVKGVNKNHPYWYRVCIAANVDKIDSLQSNKVLMVSARIHEMQPNSPQNLDNLNSLFNTIKKYKLYPALYDSAGNRMKPYFDKGILKRTLAIRMAWEIGENDLDGFAIKQNDSPIIPEGIKDIPVLRLLKKNK
jgi:hypothetical protein